MPPCASISFTVKNVVTPKKETWCLSFFPKKHIQNQVKCLPWFFLLPTGVRRSPEEAPCCCNDLPGYLDTPSNDVWPQGPSLTNSMNWHVQLLTLFVLFPSSLHSHSQGNQTVLSSVAFFPTWKLNLRSF